MSEFNAEELALLDGIRSIDTSILEAPKPKVEPKKPTLSKEERAKQQDQLKIYDAILTQKYYEESFHIGKKINGTWRTRTAGQSNIIAKMIDSMAFTTNMAVNNYINILNMSYSLIIFNGENLIDKPVNERMKMLESMPEAILVAMSRSLVDFDRKVIEAVEVGLENF